LLVAGLMWVLLHRRCLTGSEAATIGAWALGVAYLVYSVVGALTLAAGSLPAALALLVAVTVTPRGTAG
jgi:hypothetical protein